MPTKFKTAKKKARKRTSTPRRRPTSKAPRRARNFFGFGSGAAKAGKRVGKRVGKKHSHNFRAISGESTGFKRRVVIKAKTREEALRKVQELADRTGNDWYLVSDKKPGLLSRLFNPSAKKLRPGKSVSLRGRKSVRLVKRNGKAFLEVR